MKTTFVVVAAALASLASTLNAPAAVRYVDLNCANPAPPFTTWASAATNIQDAIDAADAGDVIWVTNGVYATGGKVMAGNLTNRVALDKAVTLWSVNGAQETVIQGRWDVVSTNGLGPSAVRCAWLTNGAVLSGFTLRGGATRSTGDDTTLRSGGGVWCASTYSVVANCIITSNSAACYGGGSYYGTLNNCAITGNSAYSGGGSHSGTLTNCTLAGNTASQYGGGSTYGRLNNCSLTGNSAARYGGGSYSGTLNNCTLTGNSANDGGGAYFGTLNNCLLTGNRASAYGGGAYFGTLNNCVLAGNSAASGGGAYGTYYSDLTLNNCTLTGNSAYQGGGGAVGGTLINCIVWGNVGRYGYENYDSSSLRYTCASPLAPGTGNIATDPQLLADNEHIAATSPCRTNGNALYSSGTDIDGQAWANPPSMGCDQWQPQPLVFIGPRWQLAAGVGRGVVWAVDVAGQAPFECWWTKDGEAVEDGARYGGAHTTNLLVRKFGLADAGAYQVVVSNAFGMATSQVVRAEVHCVAVAASTALAPYTNWASAATTIQAAIAAAVPGAVILVTNGLYATGGKAMVWNLTNRIAIDKAVMVMSMNGPAETVIQGQWDAVSTNGPGAVRCAWLTNGAALSGFTLRGGATRYVNNPPYYDSDFLLSGGGVWCMSTNAVVANCVITGNSAYNYGGGAYFGTLNNCALTGNSASQSGGGAYYSTLNNCSLTGNSANDGGGAKSGTLNNCTLTDNSANSGSGGASSGTLNNCIVWGNVGNYFAANHGSCTVSYSCAPSTIIGGSPPLAWGTGNIAVDPQLLADKVHIAATSPCRTNGNALYASGTDIDGQPWGNPPSMGCDQWQPQPIITVPPLWQPSAKAGQALLLAVVAGQAPFECWWTKDGAVIEDGARYGGAHTTSLLVRGFGPDDAGAYQVVVSNAFGIATSPVARVVVHCVDAAATTPLAPYTNWAAAAVTIQAAIDTAAPGAVILVTNGVYATGGKAMFGNLTNRVALNKAVTVWSVNGPQETIIRGQWDAVSTNGLGPGAVRCAWLTNGAVLSGFTLRGGATRWASGGVTLGSGGGVWCASTNAVVANCIITGNSAACNGGGAYYGTLNNCTLTGNSASWYGGGAYGDQWGFATLNNCTLTGNQAIYGGGAYGDYWYSVTLNNCTMTGNSASNFGGGLRSGTANNCIIWGNVALNGVGANYDSSPVLRYTCSSPLASGPGNIATDPQLVDGAHIAVTSPCRGKGSSLYASGTDIDGESWTNPPAMGCDEVWASGLTGPLSVVITAAQPEVVVKRTLGLTGWSTGRVSRVEWAFGDGSVATNISYLATHAWTNTGNYTVTFTAFNTDHPAGVSTNLLVHVVPLELPVLAVGGMGSNNYQLTFGSQAGVNYVVEYATNLTPPMVWQTLQSRTSTGGVIQVRDSNATNAARFYRVRMP